MATISISLNKEAEESLDALVRDNAGANRSDVMRRALLQFSEDEAVRRFMEGKQEIAEGKLLRGDTREILFGK